MTKHRSTIIAVAIILTILLALSCLIPRIALYVLVKGVMPDCTKAEYITDYTVTDDTAVTEHANGYSYKIPSHYTKEAIKKDDFDVCAYSAPNADAEIPYKYLIINNASDVEMNLLDKSYYEGEDAFKFIKEKNAEEIFASLGYGTPDSFYNVTKCVALLDYEDYSFWNLDKTVAFFTYASLRVAAYPNTRFYIYERDDVRAIVQTAIFQEDESKAQFQIDIFHKDHLNKPYGTILVVKDYEEMVSFLNSISFEE